MINTLASHHCSPGLISTVSAWEMAYGQAGAFFFGGGDSGFSHQLKVIEMPLVALVSLRRILDKQSFNFLDLFSCDL